MKKYTKNNTEVEASQYDGSQESFDNILESIEDSKKERFTHSEGERGELMFNIACKARITQIYPTEWVVKDGKYYFVVSDNIFQDMFTEVV